MGERAREPRSGAQQGPRTAPESVGEALERARTHARAAASEALAAARALLDAASLGISGAPSDAHRGIGTLARSLDDLSASLAATPDGLPPSVLDAITGALDVEIARWEERSSEDPDARAVLRAFLGLREILWELGVRSRGSETAHAESAEAGARAERAAPPRGGERAPAGERRSKKKRVQRVRVQG